MERSFNVTAVDSEPQTESLMRALPNQQKVNYVNSAFNDFEFGQYDVVNAQWCVTPGRWRTWDTWKVESSGG